MAGQLKNVTLTKIDRMVPVWQVVRGDRDTAGLCINISRYDSGVDLGALGWCVKVANAAGDTDVIPVEVSVSDAWIVFDWVFPAIVAGAVGNTLIEVEGVDGDGCRVWQSGKRVIAVIGDLDAEPGYEPQEVSEFERVVGEVGAKVRVMGAQVDGFEQRVAEAVADAETAAGSARVAADGSNVAANNATNAAGEATRAAGAATSAAEDVKRRADAGEFDGKDGYTPVKGLDYHDGADGKDWVPTAAEIEGIAGSAANKLQPSMSEMTRKIDNATSDIEGIDRRVETLEQRPDVQPYDDTEIRGSIVKNTDNIRTLEKVFDVVEDRADGDKTVPDRAVKAEVVGFGGKSVVRDGEIVSADVESVTAIGVNMFDADSVSKGYILEFDGTLGHAAGYWVSDFIPVHAGVAYNCPVKGSSRNVLYDRNKSYHAYVGNSGGESNGFAPNIDGYIRICGTVDYSSFIFAKGAAVSDYKPYIGTVIRAIPESVRNLDGYGWAVGDIRNTVERDESGRWWYHKRVGSVDLGTLTWRWSGSNSGFICAIDNMYSPEQHGTMPNMVVNHTHTVCKYNARKESVDTVSTYTSNIVLSGSNRLSTDDINALVNGVMLYYELATPITTDITDLIGDALEGFAVEAGGTVSFDNVAMLDVPNVVRYLFKPTHTDVRINGQSIVEDGIADIRTDGTLSFNDDMLFVSTAGPTAIRERQSGYMIHSGTLNRAVEAALTDDKKMQLSDASKAAACQTIGAEREGKYELIESVVLNSKSLFSRTAEPNGTPYNFKKIRIITEAPSGSHNVSNYWCVPSKAWGNVAVYTGPTSNVDTKKYSDAVIDVSKGVIFSHGHTASDEYFSVTNYAYGTPYLATKRTIDSIVGIASMYDFPEGTEIRIYAVR